MARELDALRRALPTDCASAALADALAALHIAGFAAAPAAVLLRGEVPRPMAISAVASREPEGPPSSVAAL